MSLNDLLAEMYFTFQQFYPALAADEECNLYFTKCRVPMQTVDLLTQQTDNESDALS